MYRTIFLLSFVLCLAGCGSKKSSDENQPEATPYAEVTITHATPGSISEQTVLSATTAYLAKSVVAAPVAAFITQADVMPGMRVSAGRRLYTLESKEQHALGDAAVAPPISVKAPQGGILVDVQQQAGSYVSEGATLCTIADAASMVFEINVPYELLRYARQGSRCTIELPDGTRLSATLSQPMATMNAQAQAELVVARAKSPFLPEGMNVKAILSTARNSSAGGMILPKDAVQSDETQTEFWIMVADKNGIARKKAVTVVARNETQTEVNCATLSPADAVIVSGSYGLADGEHVKITSASH